MFDLPVLEGRTSLVFAPMVTFINTSGSTLPYNNETGFGFLKLFYLTQHKEKNIKILDGILALEKNWNGNDANPFSLDLVTKAKSIINELKIQPKVFPTGDDSIQLDYEKASGDYLEFEIYNDKIKCFSIINDIENTSILTTTSQIVDTISAFYA